MPGKLKNNKIRCCQRRIQKRGLWRLSLLWISKIYNFQSFIKPQQWLSPTLNKLLNTPLNAAPSSNVGLLWIRGGGSSTLNFPGRKTQWKITKHMYVTKGQKFINEKEVVELGVANSTSYRIIPKLRNY